MRLNNNSFNGTKNAIVRKLKGKTDLGKLLNESITYKQAELRKMKTKKTQ